MSFLKSLKKALAWLFPFYCLGCKQEDSMICCKCLETIPRPEEQVCPYCRKSNIFGKTCDKCLKNGAKLDGLLVGCIYEKQGLIAKALHNFKYNGQIEYAEKLVGLMNEVIANNVAFKKATKSAIISPIPLFFKKQQIRGFNQSDILLKGLELKNQKLDLLERIKYEKAQISLKVKDRSINVKEAFRILANNFNKNIEQVILVDDVATTLATLEEAARTLKDQGVKEVYGLVLARENFRNYKRTD